MLNGHRMLRVYWETKQYPEIGHGHSTLQEFVSALISVYVNAIILIPNPALFTTFVTQGFPEAF